VFKPLRVEGISSVARLSSPVWGLDQGIPPDFLSVGSIILSEGADGDTTAGNQREAIE
jgi:hypothetical protein